MKKVLLFAGMAALMAACSNEELVPNENAGGVNGAAKGIVFETAPLEETRGELTIDGEAHNFFWYAEEDRINVYATNVAAVKDGTGEAATGNTENKGVVTNMNFSGSLVPAVYKATRSEKTGRFTAINDENWIRFMNDADVAVIATYPAGVTRVTGVKAEQHKVKVDDTEYPVTKEIKSVGFETTISTEQEVGYNTIKAPMISKQVGHRRTAGYESVGEKLPLSFTRPFPIVKFSGATNNDTFNKDLGKLNSIKLEMKGGWLDDNHWLNPSNIAGQYSKDKDGNVTKINAVSSITVNVNGGNWMSKDKIYMAILPVNRLAGVNWWDMKPVSEKYTVTYQYDQVTLVRDYWDANNWEKENGVKAIETLDIENMYPWILTNGDANGNNRKLIINKDNFADALKWESNTQNVKWNDSFVPTSKITQVEIRPKANALTKSDYDKLKNDFKNLTWLKVDNNTTVLTKNALEGLNLTYLEMTNVTDIQFDLNDHPVGNTDALATVIMPSYDFSFNRQLTKSILNASALKVLNMSGVASMKEKYPNDGMSLKGFALLENVTVQPGVVLGPESFYGCTKLKEVNGYVQLGGYGAFQNCEELTEICIDENTKIYDYTFSGAKKLQTVMKSDESPIQPTEIGISAFEGATALENIDLTATTTIGKAAFKNAIALKGVKKKAKGLYALTVNAATIGAEAFSECQALEYICFSNLGTVEKDLLAYSNTTTDRELKEVKFGKKVTFGAGVAVVDPTTFGKSDNVKLFINPAQTYVGQKLYLGKTSGNTPTDVYQNFKTIIEE